MSKSNGSRTRIILIGGGQVGSALLENLEADHDILHWTKDIDLLDTKSITEFRPAAVINAAGKTSLAWCENNPQEAFRSNVSAPVSLRQRVSESIASTGNEIRFIHFSSGCVWDGPYDENGKPFEPNSPASPAAFYSWTKVAADALLLQEGAGHVVTLRPRQLYSGSDHPRNTLAKLLKYPALIDTPNSMTSLDVTIKTVRTILNLDSNWQGIWNVYDRGIITPYEVGKQLADAGLREMPQRLEKKDLDQWHKPRRVDTVIHDERFENAVNPRSIDEVMSESIEALKLSLHQAV